MKLSIVINCDTRPTNNSFGGNNLMGVTNTELIYDGLLNKIKFFADFEKEVIVYMDVHETPDMELIDKIRWQCDTLILRDHTNESSFNDWNFIRALQMASGDIVIKIDQDTSLFTNGKEYVQELIHLLDNHHYISYPSHWTPNAVNDGNFNYRWVSTRFFMCKRETLNFTEIIKCLTDYDYFVGKYKPSRINHWLEHILGLISNSNVFYPPIELNKGAIFCWGSYKEGTLKTLNEMKYEDIYQWIRQHPIVYPNDIHC